MGSIVRVRRKHQVVVPREAREALGVSARDDPVGDAEKGKVLVKAKPRSYAKHMLGLHRDVWKGIKLSEYPRKEREAWTKKTSSKA